MVKLPQTPPEWDAQATNPPQQTLPSGPDNASGGLLGGLQSPDWSLENSGLGFLLHPQTVAQMDLGQGSHTAQPVDAQAVQPLHWSAGDNSVHLSNEMSNVAESVGREFSEKTGRNLVVTGGARTPARQAEVMYDKFKAGDRSTYKGPSGSEILDIYNRERRQDRPETRYCRAWPRPSRRKRMPVIPYPGIWTIRRSIFRANI